MKFLDALRQISKEIEVKFSQSQLFNHSGEIGDFREQIIQDLLRPFIPERYALGTGQVFSLRDEMSKQIDIVIYDSIYSNVIFKNKNSMLFPCESVYGSIEVKSNLSSNELEKSIANVKSLKALYRKESSSLDITPIYKFQIGEALMVEHIKKNDYLGIIFGYDGLDADTVLTKLNNNLTGDKKYMPDFIFCYKKGYMILKVNKEIKPIGIDEDFYEYRCIKTNDDTITMMFLSINVCLNNIRLKAPNYNQYWVQVCRDIIK